MSVRRPTHKVTEERLEEWRKQLRRLSQQKVTQADSQTIINAICTWRELAHYQEDRGLEVVEDLDLASFIQEGTDGPATALASLKWLHEAGTMGWNLTNVQIPEAPNTRTRKRQQAVVAEPGMILEAGIVPAAEHNNPEWMALLANWLCAVGCLWHRHSTESSPQRLSASTIHARGALDNRFLLVSPCRVLQRFPMGPCRSFWTRLRSCQRTSSRPMAWPSMGKGSPILSRRSRRRPSSSSRTTWMMRRTSQPTHGGAWHQRWACSDLEPNALGDWTDEVRSSAKMPAHYEGSKEAMATRMKHMAYAIMSNLSSHESWEVIPCRSGEGGGYSSQEDQPGCSDKMAGEGIAHFSEKIIQFCSAGPREERQGEGGGSKSRPPGNAYEWQQPAFQLYNSLLFGLPLAVTSFNRYSRFVEALGRRLLACMVSMYFDDANVVDWASSKGASQAAFGQLSQCRTRAFFWGWIMTFPTSALRAPSVSGQGKDSLIRSKSWWWMPDHLLHCIQVQHPKSTEWWETVRKGPCPHNSDFKEFWSYRSDASAQTQASVFHFSTPMPTVCGCVRCSPGVSTAGEWGFLYCLDGQPWRNQGGVHSRLATGSVRPVGAGRPKDFTTGDVCHSASVGMSTTPISRETRSVVHRQRGGP